MLLKEYAKSSGWGFGLKLARALNVTPAIAYRWINGETVPIQRCPQIYLVTKGSVSLEELRPDVDWKLFNPQIEDNLEKNAELKGVAV